MGIFEDVKQAVNIEEAARCYGLSVKNGIALCPFHNERTGSLKLYSDHFHCFGCHEHGDVIKLTGQLLRLSPIDSARRLAADFNVIIHDDNTNKHHTYHRTGQAVLKTPTPHETENNAYRLICRYCDYLEHNLKAYAPHNPQEPIHPLFLEAINNIELFRYYKEIFINESFEERMSFISSNAAMLDRIYYVLSPEEQREGGELYESA